MTEQIQPPSDADLKRWEELAAAATPGPWKTTEAYGHLGVDDAEGQLFIESYGITYAVRDEDARLIAEARTAIPAMLLTIAMERQHIAELEAELAALR
ncbi:hypothetical protein [Propionicimonas sp.]|jgi:hypothetical protein|uniref:hypothetical protein n=1 Tax=Propionicimonas sp. TaxID=1955623 RepID=UPI0018472E8A|nr:hypothetical protein [Propionicimonas sp.]MBA3019672.1 hypothetical protein [Propionicimonas sp.]MBU4207983.1 hypothetical protein [Actinomycetota bacterium]MBU4411479.1 hypothetical protein [Actinomycetota bacterium]MCG2805791.1 hypothetical protein [Propionicimonas sp.]